MHANTLMRRVLWSVIAGVIAFWAVYTIFYGVVYAITGDIHLGWAVISGLAVALVSGIISCWKVFRWLTKDTPDFRP